jgi:hypothetical protein
MNKVTYTFLTIAVAAVLFSIFMFGREYQLYRMSNLMDEASKMRYCTSDYYIANKDDWSDMDDYCLEYTKVGG